jgi:ABC-type lipoprotein export system ATPase subunit
LNNEHFLNASQCSLSISGHFDTCYHDPMPDIVRLRGVSKQYAGEAEPVHALRDVSFEIAAGEFVAVTGPSGCGKSTLLHIIGAMDRPTRGEAWLRDLPLHEYDEEALTRVRRTEVGFVFQFFYLLPTFTVEENVGLPLLLAGRNHAGARVAELLQQVGLTHRTRAMPAQLSGGEMQRAAIARALIHEPPLVVADEPTGNLDSENGAQILEVLRRLCHDNGTTIVMATHSAAAAGSATRVVCMKDGRIVGG